MSRSIDAVYGAWRRADRVDSGGKVVGLAGEENEIGRRRYLVARNSAHRGGEIPEAAFDAQPGFLQSGLAAFADKERHVAAAFDQTAAEIAPDGAGAERNDPHGGNDGINRAL